MNRGRADTGFAQQRRDTAPGSYCQFTDLPERIVIFIHIHLFGVAVMRQYNGAFVRVRMNSV